MAVDLDGVAAQAHQHEPLAVVPPLLVHVGTLAAVEEPRGGRVFRPCDQDRAQEVGQRAPVADAQPAALLRQRRSSRLLQAQSAPTARAAQAIAECRSGAGRSAPATVFGAVVRYATTQRDIGPNADQTLTGRAS
jgi:hypothetical protein